MDNSAFVVKHLLLDEIGRRIEPDMSVETLLTLCEAFAHVSGVAVRQPRPQRIL